MVEHSMEPRSRSIMITNLHSACTQAEIVLFANTFGPIESISFDEQRNAFINFVERIFAGELMRAVTGVPIYLGLSQVGFHWATPPDDDPALKAHIDAGASRNLFVMNFGNATPEELSELFAQHSIVIDIVMKDR